MYWCFWCKSLHEAPSYSWLDLRQIALDPAQVFVLNFIVQSKCTFVVSVCCFDFHSRIVSHLQRMAASKTADVRKSKMSWRGKYPLILVMILSSLIRRTVTMVKLCWPVINVGKQLDLSKNQRNVSVTEVGLGIWWWHTCSILLCCVYLSLTNWRFLSLTW